MTFLGDWVRLGEPFVVSKVFRAPIYVEHGEEHINFAGEHDAEEPVFEEGLLVDGLLNYCVAIHLHSRLQLVIEGLIFFPAIEPIQKFVPILLQHLLLLFIDTLT